MTPAGLLGTLSDWYERNQDKLVGSGIRGAATRGLLGLEPPKDATKAEMEAYRNFANASMAVAAGPVAATRAMRGAKTAKSAAGRKVRAASDDVYEVMDSTFNYGKLAGNKTIPIEKLSGGVRMDDPREASRVRALAEKIASPEGYVSRLIVDDAGNVIEGQHRLEALRMLGDKDVPVTVIQDLSNKYNVRAMEEAIEKTLHPDQVGQMVKRAIDALEEAGSPEKALSQYQMPGRFKKPFEDAITAASFKKRLPREEALETARQNAVKMLGLPESNTAMDRAKAMGFGDDWYHGTQNAKDGIDAFKPSIGYAGQAPTSAVWMAQHPYVADDFATWIHGAGNPTVYPVKVRSGNVANIADLEEAAIAARVDPDPQMSLYSAKVQSSLKSKGFDSARFDSGDGDYKVVFDPSRIRSRFAAFDPARIDEKDLLASLAAMGITLPLTMGLLSDQTD